MRSLSAGAVSSSPRERAISFPIMAETSTPATVTLQGEEMKKLMKESIKEIVQEEPSFLAPSQSTSADAPQPGRGQSSGKSAAIYPRLDV